MKAWVILLLSALAGCASAPPMPPAADLFHDAAFDTPNPPIDPAAALAVSPAMHAYLGSRLARRTGAADRRLQLIDALRRGDLKLEYDAALTRTAAQAFEARSGNCLALVLMTAAFARELGLSVRYQAVIGDAVWDRADDLYIAAGHVNLRLDDPAPNAYVKAELTIDFLAPQDAQSLRVREIDEHTVVAMYLNNRAVESLAVGRTTDAYWWAREALRADPEMLGAYVTLGVVYRAAHQPAWSEEVLERVARRDPDHLLAMSNRILALRDLGRRDEADRLLQRLDALDPHPPFSYFHEGMAALRQGRPEAAQRLFEKEVARAPYHHEFEYWLAVACLARNDAAQAKAHLARAMEVSTTRSTRELYAAKLERLKALQPPL